MRIKWLYTIVMLMLALSGWAQEATLEVQTDREEIMIGEQIKMRITMRTASADTAVFPQIGDTLRKEIEVLQRGKVDTTYEGAQLEQRILTQDFIITSFDSGYFPVEPLIGYINGDEVQSNPFLVGVQTIKVDTAKGIVDIKDIERVPFAWKEWIQENWHWFAIVIAAAGIITYIALYFSNKQVAVAAAPVVPARPVHEVALERLYALREEELWQKGKIKVYYSELTDILREYIELRFGIPALEQTTDEIVTAMHHDPEFSDETKSKVKRLLFLADLVKFAKENPIGQENELHFLVVETFIKESILIVNDKSTQEDHG